MEQETQSVGPLVGVIIILFIMVIGGIYFIQTTNTVINQNALTAEEIRNSIDAQTESLKSLGASDEIESIESDAELTDLTNLLPEITLIEKEL